MGLLRPQLCGYAGFIVDKLDEGLPGIDRAALLAWAAHTRTVCRFGSECGLGFVIQTHWTWAHPNWNGRAPVTWRLGGLQEIL